MLSGLSAVKNFLTFERSQMFWNASLEMITVSSSLRLSVKILSAICDGSICVFCNLGLSAFAISWCATLPLRPCVGYKMPAAVSKSVFLFRQCCMELVPDLCRPICRMTLFNPTFRSHIRVDNTMLDKAQRSIINNFGLPLINISEPTYCWIGVDFRICKIFDATVVKIGACLWSIVEYFQFNDCSCECCWSFIDRCLGL